MDDEVRDRLLPGCLIETAAARCFFNLVSGEHNSRDYQYSRKTEFGYFWDSYLEKWIMFDNRMGTFFVSICNTSDEAFNLLIDGEELFAP